MTKRIVLVLLFLSGWFLLPVPTPVESSEDPSAKFLQALNSGRAKVLAAAPSNRPRVALLPFEGVGAPESLIQALTRTAAQNLSTGVDIIEIKPSDTRSSDAGSSAACALEPVCVDRVLAAAKAKALITGVIELNASGSAAGVEGAGGARLLIMVVAPGWSVSYVERRVPLQDEGIAESLREVLAMANGSVFAESAKKGKWETLSLSLELPSPAISQLPPTDTGDPLDEGVMAETALDRAAVETPPATPEPEKVQKPSQKTAKKSSKASKKSASKEKVKAPEKVPEKAPEPPAPEVAETPEPEKVSVAPAKKTGSKSIAESLEDPGTDADLEALEDHADSKSGSRKEASPKPRRAPRPPKEQAEVPVKKARTLSWPQRSPKGAWHGLSLELQVGGGYGGLAMRADSQIAVNSSNVVAGQYQWVVRENAPGLALQVGAGFAVHEKLELGLEFGGTPADKSIELATYYADPLPDYKTGQTGLDWHLFLMGNVRYFPLTHPLVRPYLGLGAGLWHMPGFAQFDPLATIHPAFGPFQRLAIAPSLGVRILIGPRAYFLMEGRLMVDPGEAYLLKDLDADGAISVNELVSPPAAARSVGTFRLGFGGLL